jgi:hypothetical protein
LRDLPDERAGKAISGPARGGDGMSEQGKYFQFPLALLAYGSSKSERLSAIVDLCCVNAGKKQMQTFDESCTMAMAEALQNPPAGLDLEKEDHLILALGMKILNVANGNAKMMITAAAAAEKFLRDHDGRFGASPFVRVGSSLFWETFKETMDYRMFSTVCAVNAILGQKSYCRLTRDRIINAQLGYKSAAVATAMLPKRKDGLVPLTHSQCRTVLDKIENKKLIVRCQVSPRKTMFSTRMTLEELAQVSLEKELTTKDRSAANRETVKAIKAAILLKRRFSSEPGKTTLAPPQPSPPTSPRTSPPTSPL